MFTFSGRFRRRVAVLTVLAMVTSVLVVAAPAAAADPEADFKAKFDACDGEASEDAGFTDVADSRNNAGDIDCIAYYGITKGTSASTYSPLMSVTRVQMALFLTRLAGLVGIEVASDPADPGFTDTAGLSDESQTAIAQLADLGITQGTSDTTYSPAETVRRDHMALFISRLMNKMNPVADGSTLYGSLPSDVAENKDEKPIGSPFTDLGSTTKSAYDAIVQLWELGVASGINETSYSPSQSITRAAMAEFMARVLDHSNTRPAGLSIQTNKADGFGDITASVVMVSYRSDAFAPMEGVMVDVFSTDDGLEDDGTCKNSAVAADGVVCEQDDNDPTTDELGNIFIDGSAMPGKTNVYYAWQGKSGDKFDNDDVDEVSVALVSSKDVARLKLTTTIKENADAVDLDVTKSVTLTVQLQDEDGADVHKEDQKIQVEVRSYSSSERAAGTDNLRAVNLHTVKTDAQGKVTYTVDAPADATSGDGNDARYDTIMITSGNLSVDTDPDTADVQHLMIDWLETDPALTKALGSVTLAYSLISGTGNSATARVPVAVTLYDQYGNRYKAAGQRVTFDSTQADFGTASDSGARSASGGRATYTYTITASVTASTTIGWTATVDDGDNDAATEPPEVTTASLGVVLVSVAGDDSEIVTAVAVTGLYEKQNKFHIAGALYSYDSDDLFYQGGKPLSIDQFEAKLKAESPPTIRIPSYDDDGSSIFVLTAPAI